MVHYHFELKFNQLNPPHQNIIINQTVVLEMEKKKKKINRTSMNDMNSQNFETMICPFSNRNKSTSYN